MSQPPSVSPAQAYLERHAALLVTNSRLGAVLVIMSLFLAALTYGYIGLARSFSQLKPMVIRIDQVGHAEAVTYQSLEYKVQEAEIKYFLIDFYTRYYGRIRGTAKDDLARSLYFLLPKLATQTLADLRQTHSLEDFLTGIGDQIEVTVDQISIEDLRTQPYKAVIQYEKACYSQLDHQLLKRQTFTGHIQFIVLDKVPHNLIPLNPLGLTITYLREDQAFKDAPPRPAQRAGSLAIVP